MNKFFQNVAKRICLLLILMITFGLTACGSNSAAIPDKSDMSPGEDFNRQQEAQESSDSAESGKVLVAYFSMPETTDPNNMTEEEANSTVVMNGEVLGNTQYVAYVIEENTNANIFRIDLKRFVFSLYQ